MEASKDPLKISFLSLILSREYMDYLSCYDKKYPNKSNLKKEGRVYFGSKVEVWSVMALGLWSHLHSHSGSREGERLAPNLRFPLHLAQDPGLWNGAAHH